MIVLLGARPVFVDSEPDTCNIDGGKIEGAVTNRTKAIMPVSLNRQPATWTRSKPLRRSMGLP
jgi:UDP-2-acetamido-2-deoxy-ribo-hexuluronate aminotransferase